MKRLIALGTKLESVLIYGKRLRRLVMSIFRVLLMGARRALRPMMVLKKNSRPYSPGWASFSMNYITVPVLY